MKNLFYFIITFFVISCSSVAQNNAKGKPVTVDGVFTVQADYISGSNGCYTINVRVYLTYEGQTILLANSNVQVGDCGQRPIGNANSDCEDKEFKGDYFFYSSNTKTERCVIDLLKDDVTYAKYIIEKNRVIDLIKKK